MKAFYRGFCKVQENLFSFLFAAMVALVFLSALARGFGHPLAWSLDVAQLLLCWTSLIGADVAFREGKFIGLDLVTRRMPIKVQKILEIVVLVLILGALGIFAVYGTSLSISSWKRSFQSLPISYSFITIALPVMSVCMGTTAVLRIIDRVKNFKANCAPEVEG
ncbi:MAG: TRAP transporter small permease [Pygmaiobacter sp.]